MPAETTSQPPAAAPPRLVVTEALLAFVAVTAAVSGLYRLRSVGFVDRNLAVVAAVLFLYVPAMLLWHDTYFYWTHRLLHHPWWLRHVHGVHHRGQLSGYLRPMGGKVPAIYGGSADEPFQG